MTTTSPYPARVRELDAPSQLMNERSLMSNMNYTTKIRGMSNIKNCICSISYKWKQTSFLKLASDHNIMFEYYVTIHMVVEW